MSSAATEPRLRNIDLDAAIAEARERYVARNPKSLARLRRGHRGHAGRQHAHGAALRRRSRSAWRAARAAACGTSTGRRYIDFLGEYTAGLYGHSHPVIRAGAGRARWTTASTSARTNLTRRASPRAVCERFGLERVRFTNSGTEANLLAISRRPASSPAARRCWCSTAATTAACSASPAAARRSTRRSTSCWPPTTTSSGTRALIARARGATWPR